MRIGNFYIEFYNARKHRPVVYGLDHFGGWDRDCRPFATADVQSLLMMISNRIANVVWNSKPELLVFKDLFAFVHDNALRMLLKFFYDGFVRIDISNPADIRFAGETRREDYELTEYNVVTVFDSIYKATGRTRSENLRPHIDMLNTVNDSDLNLIMNYGAMGVLSPDNGVRTDGYFDDKQVEEIQEDYRKKYGVRFGRWALLITRRPVKFQPIQLPIKELELNEKRKSALAELLQYMNIPKELHAMFESAKYANRNEAELDMYGNCVTAWAWKFTEVIRECYAKIRLNDHDGISYPALPDVWFDIVGVPALHEAQQKEKEKAREELKMWRELKAEMPEKAAEIDQRIESIIENL
jgi:hypothetical protein